MLRLYKPALEDLWFRKKLLEDPKTMSYNHAWGGIVPFPREKWDNWYEKWITHPGAERFYRYLFQEEAKQFVGEIAYHLDASRNIYMANLLILADCRGRGYGTEGLGLLCQAAKERGVTTLYDDIAADNPSVHLFLRNGFAVDSQTADIILVKRTLSPSPQPSAPPRSGT